MSCLFVLCSQKKKHFTANQVERDDAYKEFVRGIKIREETQKPCGAWCVWSDVRERECVCLHPSEAAALGDMKGRAVVEMMDRIRKGVVLRPSVKPPVRYPPITTAVNDTSARGWMS